MPNKRPNPHAAMLVIGDEILSGRTRDANMYHLAGQLTGIGIDLQEVRVVSDNHDSIVAATKALASQFDHLFTSGGIGPTHDDITADAIGAAFGVHVGIRPDAYDLMAAHYASQGLEFNEARQRMARIPDGAVLIENPVSVAPGFSLENVHVLAGVPRIFEAMLASLLPKLTGGAPLLSDTLRVEIGEGDLAEPLGAVASSLPELSFGSYPFQRDGKYGSNIVIRGTDATALAQAKARLIQALGL